jgi:hypothetical protein
MADTKGLNVAVLTGANAPDRRVLADGVARPVAEAEVVNELAAPQPGGPRPDGFVPAAAPLPPGSGGQRNAQEAQREQVRSATPEQLAQTSRVGRR